jgi:hypothetical protein
MALAEPFDAVMDLMVYVNSLRSTPHCPTAALLDVMRRTRQVLEASDSRPSYPTVALYCDWYMHISIYMNAQGWMILKQVNSIMCEVAPSVNPVEGINAALGLDRLRSEFRNLFQSHGIDTFLFDLDRNWAALAVPLLQALSAKRLRWPDLKKYAKAKKLHAQMMQRTLAPNLYPRELYINHRPTGFQGPGFYWTFMLRKDGPHALESTGLLVLTL